MLNILHEQRRYQGGAHSEHLHVVTFIPVNRML
jgi:hypothetical protein